MPITLMYRKARCVLRSAMAFTFPQPTHMPCPDCGASVAVGAPAGAHVCDDERRTQFRLVEQQAAVERFEDDFAAWLETPHGRFARWLAEHDR